MLDVTVQRSKWLRGETTAHSKLLREADGKMCCLGFACLAAGIPEEEIRHRGAVATLLSANIHPSARSRQTRHGQLPPELQALVVSSGSQAIYDNSLWACDLMNTNDVPENAVWPMFDREAELTKLGAQHGIAFTFVD